MASFFASLLIVLFGEYKLGVDLAGGTILAYQVDADATNALNPSGAKGQWNMDGLVQVLRQRLNETGLKEITVLQIGPGEVEVTVPETDEAAVNLVKQKITTGGTLQFMIVASENKDQALYDLAKEQAAELSDEGKLAYDVKEGGVRRGYWARVGREDKTRANSPYRDSEIGFALLRVAKLKESDKPLPNQPALGTIVEVPPGARKRRRPAKLPGQRGRR